MEQYVGMLLSDIPFDKLKPGQRVRSLVTTHLGIIEDLISQGAMARENDVFILWETGHHSLTWHFWLTRVVFEGE